MILIMTINSTKERKHGNQMLYRIKCSVLYVRFTFFHHTRCDLIIMDMYMVPAYVPSCFFIKFLANSKQITRKPTPAAPPSMIATVFPVFCPEPDTQPKPNSEISIVYVNRKIKRNFAFLRQTQLFLGI